jgi:hypothetical protein
MYFDSIKLLRNEEKFQTITVLIYRGRIFYYNSKIVPNPVIAVLTSNPDKKQVTAMKGKIHIGTSGWHYKHWVITFYPADTKTIYYPSQFVGYQTYEVPVKERTITITMTDARTDKVAWQAWTTERLNYARLTQMKSIKV